VELTALEIGSVLSPRCNQIGFDSDGETGQSDGKTRHDLNLTWWNTALATAITGFARSSAQLSPEALLLGVFSVSG
jgi:hypothetical protein